MVTVATRARRISEREKFDIMVKRNVKPVAVTKNGVLGTYEYMKALKSDKTVAQWREDRFEASYPGYTCDVLLGDGSVAIGQTKLSTVRDSYED
jgi:hypothetical protein